jgi:4-hydroxybenzoate polyprenyltransferase
MIVLERLALWGSFVKFSHSIFALPFALIMMVVLARAYPLSWVQIVSLVAAVVAARTAAMAFNRLVDASIDAANPRTSGRELPSRKVSSREAWALTIVSALVFAVAASTLGMHCLMMVPPVLVVLLGYSLLKRFTSMCHFVLGLALALAPGGVWYAMTATWAWQPLWLMGAVLAWVAGFDILYSCQDMEFDRERGLFSVPRYLGFRRARLLAAGLHLATVALLAEFGVVFELHAAYAFGVALFAALLLNQHLLIARQGIACIDLVFFTRNGAASLVLFACVVLDRLIWP